MIFNNFEKPLLVIISGPTAVGKTDLTIELAKFFDTEIISADSRQFYKELEIATAKPSSKQLSEVNHHFINSLSIHQKYDVIDFENESLATIGKLFKTKNIVLVSGGSGLFIRVLCEGLDPLPEVPDIVRAIINQEYEAGGLDSLQKELAQADPEYYAEVDINNPQRVIRAIEIIRTTGQKFSSFRKKKKVERPFRVLKIVLNRDREELYERINMRVDMMFEQGLLDEAKELLSFKDLNALQTVGYSELFPALQGEYSIEEADRLIKRNSRRYAKRQLTWFKKEQDSHWFHPDQKEEIIKLIRENLDGFVA
ncbi:tRNA (adenosine(37)-N6)-dimethylallyltransferase MiaA [Fulvivirgaceae bacterium LMO-SS25]